MMMTTLKLGKTCFRCFLIIFFSKLNVTPSIKFRYGTNKNWVNWKWRNFSTRVARMFSLCKIKVARGGNYLWIECRRFIIFFFFMFRMEIDDFVSFIQVSLNTISRHFLVWRFKTFRSFNNPKWNQKFMHWFMREILFLRYSTDKSQLDSTHAFLFSLHSLFMFLLARKLVLDRIFFSFFSANACVVMFIKWISFSFENFFPSFITKFFLFLFQRTLEFNS